MSEQPEETVTQRRLRVRAEGLERSRAATDSGGLDLATIIVLGAAWLFAEDLVPDQLELAHFLLGTAIAVYAVRFVLRFGSYLNAS